MVSTVLLSVQLTYSVGMGHIAVLWFVGASLCCHGGWFGSACVVKLYVWFVQLHPSVRLTLQ